jgi:tRNA modification GTPase
MVDTIYALATSPGRAGVAVIRVSGPEAFKSLNALCKNSKIDPRKSQLRDLYTDE